MVRPSLRKEINLKKEQKVYITLPADPASPALVTFTPGPLAHEAQRLTEVPGSGWETTPSDEEGVLAFLVDPKLLHPHPKRKPRPDAAGYLAKYREEKKAQSAPAKESPEKSWDGFEF